MKQKLRLKSLILIFSLMFLPNLSVAQEPTIPASNLNFTNINGDQMYMSFTVGDGARRIVIASEGNPVTAIPSNGIDYVSNSTYGNGNEPALGEFVVYDGAGSGFWLYGLDHSTTYHFRVYEYNGTNTLTNYLTSSFLEGSQSTLTNPTVQASNILITNVDGNSMKLDWTNGNGTGRILIAKEGSPVDVEPQQLTDYSASSNFGTYQIGSTGNYVIYESTGASDTVLNLQPGTTYHFALFEYNGSGDGKVFLTTTSIPSIPGTTASQTTSSAPNENTTALNFSNINGNQMYVFNNGGAQLGNGARRIVVAKAGGPVTGSPTDGIDYNSSGTLGNGDTLNADEYVVYDGTSLGFWLYGLQPNTTYHFKVFEYDGTGANTAYLTGLDTNNNPVFESSQATLGPPTTQASNITFSNVDGNSMTVNWTNGDGSGRILVAKAGSPVDVEPQQLTDYSASSNFGTSWAQIGNTGNYVLYDSNGSSDAVSNLQPGTTYHFAVFEFNGSSNGKVYLTSTSTPNSAVPAIASQTTATGPTENTTSLNFININGNQMYVFNNGGAQLGNGARRIVVAKAGGPVTGSPVDGTDYTASSTFGSGDTLDAGEYIIYDGTGLGFWLYGLLPNTTYHFKVFEYNGTGANTAYLTGLDINNNPVFESSQATLGPPTTQASNITFSNVDGNSMTVNWTNGDGSGRILVAKAGSPVDVEPQQLTDYSENSNFGTSWAQIGNTGNYVLYDGNGSSDAVSNLQPGTVYHFAVFEFNGSSSGKVYLTSTSIPNSAVAAIGSQETATAPTENTTTLNFSNLNGNQMYVFNNGGAQLGNGGRRIVVARAGNPVTGSPVDGTSYTASNTFGSGDTLNPNEYVVYDGTGLGFWLYGLLPNTTYHFKVFEYNGTATNTFYLTGLDTNSNPVFESSQATIGPPTINSTSVFFNSKTNSSFNLNWTNGNGNGRILIAKEGSPVDVEPQDLVNYSSSGSFGQSWAEIGTDNYVIYDSTGNSVNVTNLNPGTNYYFELFEYNGTSSGKVYLRPGYTFQEQTFGTTPTIQVSNPLFSVITSTSMVVDFDKGDGSHRLVLVKKDSPVDASPTDLTNYLASNLFGSGDEIGTGNFVAFSGTGEVFQLTDLDPTSTYHFAFFEYALSQNGNLYLTPGLAASETTSSLPCQIPTNLNVTNITNTSATMSWGVEATALLGYDYVLNTDGSIPDGATPPTGNIGTGINTIDLTSLTANTTYYFFVRSNCEISNQSQWSNFQNFTTLCDQPVAIAQDITVQLDANGEVNITPNQVDNGSILNCGTSNLSLDINYFDCNDIGDNTVTLTVTDLDNNTDSATATVTVLDIAKPEVVTQDITIQLDATGQATITPAQINNGSTDNCAIDSMVLNKTTFNCDDIGPNTVTLTVTDINDNSGVGTATVTVQELNPPTVVTQDINVQLGGDGIVKIEPDDVDGGSTDDCGIANLSLDIDTFTVSDLGPNTVTLTVTDGSGNSESDTAIVTVQNASLPNVITQDITVQLDPNGLVTISPEDIDNGSTSSGTTSLSLNITSFDCSDIGPNAVILTVSDGLGNSETGTATVTVEDNLAPIAVAQDVTVEIDENGQGTLMANAVDNGSTDNCGIASITIDKMSFSCSDIGLETVTLTVTDVNGNSSTAISNVTVEDQNPTNIWYADNDMDGFGDDNNTITSCAKPAGYVAQGGDCNDNDNTVYPGAQSFDFTGNIGFANTVVSPIEGAPTDTYTFEVVYFDVNNEMPGFGFPRAIVDFNSDGNYSGANDRTIVLSELDPSDTNLIDGKTYVGSITPLAVHQNYQVLVQTVLNGCESIFGPFDAPDVLEPNDIEIFASDIQFSEDNPDVNTSLTVSAEVHNASDLPAENFSVGLVNQFDDTVYPDVFVNVIPPQSSTIVTWQITTPSVDAFVPMQVIIDKNNDIAESNELDNTAVRPFVNGEYNVPGNIDVTNVAVNPSSGTTSTKYRISGNASYTDLAVELDDPTVKGAEVSIYVTELGETFIGYTNNAGNFNVFIPNGNFIAPGLYNFTGSVTDFTLTSDEFTGQFIVNPDPVDYRVSVSFNPDEALDIGNPTASLSIIVTNIGFQDALQNTNLAISQSLGFTALPNNETIPPLASGQSQVFTYNNLTFSGVGVYTVQAIADSNGLLLESNLANNVNSDSIEILEPKPDLVFNGGPNGILYLCQNIGTDVSFGIRNNGNVPTSVPFTTTIQVFKNGVLENTYQEVYNGVLNVNQTGSVSIPNPYAEAAQYSFVLDIDSSDQVIEINETNNGGSGSRNVVECKPDLVVGLCHDNLTVSPIDPLDGGNVTYSAEIRNNGQIANSTGFTVLFQVDSPGGISSYTQVFNGTLNPFNSTIISVNAPLAPEDSELTVFVDSNNDIDENSEANNTAGSIELCHEFRLQRPGPNQFWQDDTFFQFENVVPNINLRAFNAYTASAVNVKFEVSGPGIPAILDLGTVTINNVNECDEPPTGYPVFLPTSFVFNELGTYTFTFTVDPDNDYLECDDTNNVYTRDVEVESLSDMRTLSEFINPSLLNPDVNEPVTLDITYENLGFQNVADEMDLKVFVNEVEIATIQNVPGLLTDTNNTVTVPVPFQSNIPGANVVKVFIDSENEIVELNEDNNEATRVIIVGDASNLYFEEFIAFNTMQGGNNITQLQAEVGNDGILDSDAELRFTYFTENGAEILIGQIPIQVTAGGTSIYNINWPSANPQATLKAEIINATVPEFNELDNVITLENTVDFTLQNPNPQSLNVVEGNTLDISVDIASAFTTIPFLIDDVQVSAYLSTDCMFDVNTDELLGTTTLDMAINQSSATATINTTIPFLMNNTNYQVIWVVDGNMLFEETNEDNNQLCISVNSTDITAPTAIAQDINVTLDANGQATITVDDIDNGSTDNQTAQSNLTRSLDITSFDCSNLGPNTVTLTVGDTSGNSDTATAIVTVEDDMNPVAIVQDVIALLDSNGQVTVTAMEVGGESYDNCSIASAVLDQNTFDCTNIGSNLVTLTVTDGSGNTDSQTANVTVVDLASPMAITQDITVYLDANGQASIVPGDIDNGSTDNCTIVNSVLDAESFDCSDLGPNMVTLTVTDQSGNSDSTMATVTVQDNTDPVAMVQDITVYLDANGQASIVSGDIDNGSTDNCTIVNSVLDAESFDCSDLGPNMVTLTVTDQSGNSDSAMATVTVEDNTDPVAVSQDITVSLDSNGNVTILPAQVDGGSTDNCAIASLSLDVDTFTSADLGPNTVTLTVTDTSGNTDFTTAVVTVTNTNVPNVITQNISVYLDANGMTSITPQMIDNGSTTCCGNTLLSLDITNFDCSNLGSNTVTLTVSDGVGGSNTGTAIVTVVDNTDPVAVAQNFTVTLDASGMATITSGDINNGSSDNCAIASSALDITSFDCSDLGPNTVTLTVTDTSGNTNSTTATVTVQDNPIVANAGPDQTGLASGVCGNSTTLEAITPTAGNGLWSITGVADGMGMIADPSNPLSNFAGTPGQTYTLTWTISNASCIDSTDTVDIEFFNEPSVADAGADQDVCRTSTKLEAVNPTSGVGSWTIISGAGGTLTSPSSPTSGFSGTVGATYTLQWTVSSAPCQDSTDTVDITFFDNPTVAAAGADQEECETTVTLAANTPTVGTGNWTITGAADGLGVIASPTDPNSSFTGTAGQTYTLTWTISNGSCDDSTDTVDIEFINDNTAPIFENNTPSVSAITNSGATLETDIDEAGMIYFILVADGANAPTSAEVKAGTGSGGASVIDSGDQLVNSGDFDHDFTLSGLTEGTPYDIYLVAEESLCASNLQDTPTLVEFTTTAPTPEINVTGNGQNIASGSTTSNVDNHTNFGSLDVINGSLTRTYTIENIGGFELALTGGSDLVSLTGSSDFSVSQQPSGSTISPNGSLTFDITFDPSTSGNKTATVSIANSDSDENPYTFVVQGSGGNANSNFILAADGKTCLCPNATDGETGELTINGVNKIFTRRNRTQLEALISNNVNDPEIALTCTSGITNMQDLFNGKGVFNQDLSAWDVSNVTTMRRMFQNSSFNHNIGHWDVANVTNMAQMFRNTPFNQAIGDWNVSNVTRMHLMFKQASSFNQDIGDWEVVNVTNMREMFMQATSFNQDIGSWDVSSVTNMNRMFRQASVFNQDISDWCVEHINSEPLEFAQNSALIDIHKPNWGQVCGNVDSNFILAADGKTCLCPNATDGETGELTINGVNKIFTRRNRTQLEALISNNVNDPEIALTCTSGITDMSALFDGENAFNQDLIHWDVSNVTTMRRMFQNSNFNHDIGHWDVSNVTNMAQMFRGTPFNQAIGNWDVSNVTRMHLMFKQASSFNQDIGDWEVVNVTNMREMFMQATGFNQDIGSWDVSGVTNMNKMFNAASIFNQDLSNWCVTLISSEPNAFSTGSPLTNPHKPDWGNCNVPMGVDENTLKLIVQDAEVYPNPFVSTQHRKLSITWEGELNIEELKLVDLYGREMRIDGIQIMHDSASFQMPIQLSEGVYLLQITSHGHVFNKRIAVKH